MNSSKYFYKSIFLSAQLALCTAIMSPVAAAELNPVFDVDGDSKYMALTDGLLLLRYNFDFRGASLISNAVGADATRETADQITAYLDNHQTEFDIDGNGVNGALSDGLLFLRYLFDFKGESLLSGAVVDGAPRDSSGAITKHLTGSCPTFFIDTASATRCTSYGLATYSFLGDSVGNGNIVIQPTAACPEQQSAPINNAPLTYTLSNLAIDGTCKATAAMTVILDGGFFSQTENRNISIVDGIATML